jgi:hypothetical protein
MWWELRLSRVFTMLYIVYISKVVDSYMYIL